ncbi:hypothetical protein OSTOST_04990 [Ostertagia ostertagi]
MCFTNIRSFFGGKKSGNQESSSGSSALSAIRKAAPSTPTSETKKRSDKLVPNKSEPKAKKPKKAAVAVVDLSESDDSEGESPIPASLRKEALKQKRSRALVVSDSDEDFIPKKASKGAIKSVTPSPVKSPPKVKRSRIVVSDSEEDATPSPKKKKGKEKARPPAPESGDEEVTSETDSENEFMEKKKPKKVQKKLGFDKDSKKTTPAKDKKSEEKLERVSANEVFGGARTDGKAAHPSKKKDVPSKASKISPSQKENDVARKHEKPKKKVLRF